jgi:hypothetical protein
MQAFRQTASILRAVRPDMRTVELAGAGHLCILQAPGVTAKLLARHWRHR